MTLSQTMMVESSPCRSGILSVLIICVNQALGHMSKAKYEGNPETTNQHRFNSII